MTEDVLKIYTNVYIYIYLFIINRLFLSAISPKRS